MNDADYEQAVAAFYDALYAFGFSLAGNEDDACELTQETYCRLLAKGSQLRDPSKVKSWLFAAGAFRFRVAESFAGRWLVEWTANFRSRWSQQPYGDQALFLRRSWFEELGGLPIMEDYELNQRLRRIGCIATAREVATTSGRRWKHLGVVRTTMINKMMIAGFRLGVCPHKLAKFYRRLPDNG